MSLVPTFKVADITIDRATLKKHIQKTKRNAMTKQLAFIRTRARSLLRKRKRLSRPGEIPSVHSTDRNASLKTIFFIYDSVTGTGVVGPVKQNVKTFGVTTDGTAPQVLEHGGTYKRTEQRVGGRWVRAKRSRRSSGTETRRRTIRVQPRPFMSVALRAEVDAGTIMDPWANSFGA